MNRHIFGLALFLVIVKINLLLYWAFFAPVTFYSVDEPVFIQTGNRKVCTSFKVKKFLPDLQNIEVDTRQGSVTARVDARSLDKSFDWSRVRLHIFTEKSGFVWSGKIFPTTEPAGSATLVSQSSPELKRLSRNVNYYAQIEFLSDSATRGEKLVYEINQATPVLLNTGKN